MVLCRSRYAHVSSFLWAANLLRVQFKVLVVIFKALYGLGPGYLRDCFLPDLQSGEVGNLWVLSPKEVYLAGPRRRASFVVAPSLYHPYRDKIGLHSFARPQRFGFANQPRSPRMGEGAWKTDYWELESYCFFVVFILSFYFCK